MWGGLIRKTAVVIAITLAIYLVVDLLAGLIIGPLHRSTPDFAAIPGFRGQPYATPGFAFEYTEMQSFDTMLGKAATTMSTGFRPPTPITAGRSIPPIPRRRPAWCWSSAALSSSVRRSPIP